MKTNRDVKEVYSIKSHNGNVNCKTSNKETIDKYKKRQLAASKTIYGDRYPLYIKKLEVTN